MSHTPLIDPRVWQLLLTVDRDLAAEARAAGCTARGTGANRGAGCPPSCRESIAGARACAARARSAGDGPHRPNVRFFGRRVFVAAVVLVSAMTGGLSARRAGQLRAQFGVRERTLQRWRAWWLQTFPRTAFWKGARARLMPGVDESRLPASLLERFADPSGAGLVACLTILAPITTRQGYAMAA